MSHMQMQPSSVARAGKLKQGMLTHHKLMQPLCSLVWCQCKCTLHARFSVSKSPTFTGLQLTPPLSHHQGVPSHLPWIMPPTSGALLWALTVPVFLPLHWAVPIRTQMPSFSKDRRNQDKLLPFPHPFAAAVSPVPHSLFTMSSTGQAPATPHLCGPSHTT